MRPLPEPSARWNHRSMGGSRKLIVLASTLAFSAFVSASLPSFARAAEVAAANSVNPALPATSGTLAPVLTGPMATAEKLGDADKKIRVEAEIHQMKSSADRPYTLFEYPVPTTGAVPHILAIDPKDQVWFSESGGRFAKNFIDVPAQNRIARLDKSGTLSEWALPQTESSPMGVVFDLDGGLWIVERLANRITLLEKDGKLRYFDIPTPAAWPTANAIDSQGRLWFTETKGDKIGVIDKKAGTLKEYALPQVKTMSTGIAVDNRDRIWIAERDVNTIAMFDPKTEKFTEFPLPTPDARPCGIAVGADGKVWFSQRGAGKIATIDDQGNIQEYATPERFGGPFLMAVDRRGDVWFSEIFSGKIGRFDTAKQTFEYFSIPGDKVHPAGVALDSKGNLWYAAQSSNRVGVIVRTDLSYIANEEPGADQTTVAEAAPHEIIEMTIPTKQSIPGIVGIDRHDTVWFTQMGGGWVGPGFPPGPPGSNIGYVKDGKLHEIPTLTPNAGPTSLGIDPCGDDVWFSLRAANKIARVRNFELTEYDVPVPNSLPVGITVDNDHNVWVAMSEGNKFGRRTPDGEWKIIDVPTPNAEPRTIYVDPWNEVWFAEKTGNHVGHIDTKTWKLTQWEIPTQVAWPLSLIADNDGNIWFAEMRSDKLAMLDRKTKKITEYNLPVQSAPFKVNYDPQNDAMWVSTVFYNSIIRFSMSEKKVVGIYKVPSEGAWVGGLDRDSQGCLWFTEQFANKVGKMCIEGVASPAAMTAMRSGSVAIPSQAAGQ